MVRVIAEDYCGIQEEERGSLEKVREAGPSNILRDRRLFLRDHTVCTSCSMAGLKWLPVRVVNSNRSEFTIRLTLSGMVRSDPVSVGIN